MGHVKHQSRLARHHLEAPGKLDHGKAIAHGLRGDRQAVAQCGEGGQHARGVQQLVGAAQRGIAQARVAAAATGPAPLLLVTREVEVTTEQPQVTAQAFGDSDHRLRRYRVAHHHRPAGPHHTRLLPADRLAVRAQVVLVVEVDAGDDGAVGVDQVHRVQPATQTDLQNGQLQATGSHQAKDGQGGELKIGQGHPLAGLLHPLEMRQQRRLGGNLAAQAAALLEVHQVGRGVHPAAPARLEGDGLEHGAGRALAVGTGHGNHRAVKAQAHAVSHRAHAVQPQLHRFGMQALAVRQPVLQGIHGG